MKLLLSQKDEIFELIQSFDLLNPHQFEIEEALDSSKTSINFKGTEYWFQFIKGSSGYFAKFSPGREEYIEFTEYLDWSRALKNVFYWLSSLERELTTPDHWGKFKAEISGISFNFEYDNEKFNYKEFLELEKSVDKIKSGLAAIPLIREQQEEIISHLDRLTETAKELGKYDWKNLFVGTMISIIIQLNITPANAHAVWELIKNSFNHYFLK